MTDAPPPAASPEQSRRPRPWFPWYLYVLVAISGLQHFADGEERDPARLTGYVFGGALIAFLVMLLAYRLSKHAWVAALVWFALLLLPASRSIAERGKVSTAIAVVHDEVHRMTASLSLALHDFAIAGGVDPGTLANSEALQARGKIAAKARDEARALLALLQDEQPLRSLLATRGLTPREFDRTRTALRDDPDHALVIDLVTAERDTVDAALALLDLLHEEMGHWSVGNERELLFDERAAKK